MRQAAFLGALAETRSVSAAARKVKMARETAYRLRKAAGGESFAAAWDAVMGRVTAPRAKVTHEERARRAIEGLLKPVMYRGKHVATARKADNSALLAHAAALDRAERLLRKYDGKSQSFTASSVSRKR
jgi:molybdenum-dependent DNA-binding transcriptional regulator ModE